MEIDKAGVEPGSKQQPALIRHQQQGGNGRNAPKPVNASENDNIKHDYDEQSQPGVAGVKKGKSPQNMQKQLIDEKAVGARAFLPDGGVDERQIKSDCHQQINQYLGDRKNVVGRR